MARQRIGVFLPTWVGDGVMATPTLRVLRSAFPQADFVGVMRPVLRDLFAGSQYFDECLLFEKKTQNGLPNRIGLIGSLRKSNLDALILLTNSFWTAFVGRLAGVPRIVGYARDGRRWLLHEPIAVKSEAKPPVCTIDEYLYIAEQLGCDTNNRQMELKVTSEESLWADQLWESCGLSNAVPTVVINSGSATDVSRLWPVEHVQELAQNLARNRGLQVVLHCGPGERTMADRIAKQVNDSRVVSMGAACAMTDSKASTLPIGLSKAVLSRASAVVSTDSGPRHIAVALNRPVVSLFGPTDPLRTQTFNIAELPIATALECGKCYASRCPFKHGNCMRGLEVQRVYDSVVEILRRQERSAA